MAFAFDKMRGRLRTVFNGKINSSITHFVKSVRSCPSTDSVVFDVPPPSKDANPSVKVRIEPVAAGKRLWLISIQQLQNYNNNATLQPSEISINHSSQAKISKFSVMQAGATPQPPIPKVGFDPPVNITYTTGTLCQAARVNFSSPPNFVDHPAYDICWFCVSPPPLTGLWKKPPTTSQYEDDSPVAWGKGASTATKKERLAALLNDYYGLKNAEVQKFDGTTSSGLSLTVMNYLERQWTLAMVFTEGEGAVPTEAEKPAYQRQLILTAILAPARYAYYCAVPNKLNKYSSSSSTVGDEGAAKLAKKANKNGGRFFRESKCSARN